MHGPHRRREQLRATARLEREGAFDRAFQLHTRILDASDAGFLPHATPAAPRALSRAPETRNRAAWRPSGSGRSRIARTTFRREIRHAARATEANVITAPAANAKTTRLSFTAPEMARHYRFPSGVDGRGQTIGVTLYGEPNPELVQFLESAGATVATVWISETRHKILEQISP